MSEIAHTPPDEGNLWLPPRRLVRYQLVKIVAAALLVCFFVAWLVLLWQVTPVRFLVLALVVVTVWVTVQSACSDVARSRGRQLEIRGEMLCGRHKNRNIEIRLGEVSHAQWRERSDDELGLWLYDAGGNVLVHLDCGFFRTQAEARAFLAWLRRRAAGSFEVRWPEANVNSDPVDRQ